MIGVLGGTFNPIHYGHLRSALEVRQLFELTQVRLIPSANPPHRAEPTVPAWMRAEMVQLAVHNQPDLVCDTREIDRYQASPLVRSYTLDTLQSLHADFPKQTLLLFIGSDAFNQLPTWYCWQQLFDYAHIVVMTRPDYQPSTLNEFIRDKLANNPNELRQTSAGKLFFQAVTPLAISATTIRHLIATQQSPRFLLPDVVLNYIQQHQLYQAINK